MWKKISQNLFNVRRHFSESINYFCIPHTEQTILEASCWKEVERTLKAGRTIKEMNPACDFAREVLCLSHWKKNVSFLNLMFSPVRTTRTQKKFSVESVAWGETGRPIDFSVSPYVTLNKILVVKKQSWASKSEIDVFKFQWWKNISEIWTCSKNSSSTLFALQNYFNYTIY